MKIQKSVSFVFILLLFVSLTINAHDFSQDHKIENWRKDIPISVEDIHDLIWEEAWEVFTGDDGEECDAQIWGIKIVQYFSLHHFEISFRAQQDFERNIACTSNEIVCSGTVRIEVGKTPRARGAFNCDWKL